MAAIEVLAFSKTMSGALRVRLRTGAGEPEFELDADNLPPALQTAVAQLEAAIVDAATQRFEGLAATNVALRQRIETADDRIDEAIAAVQASSLSQAAKDQVIAHFQNVRGALAVGA